MGFRFRKSINLGGGIKLNLNKKSAGLSFGGKGFRYSMNTKGRKTTSVGIPGTGLYYTKSSGGNKKNSKYQKTANNFNPPSNRTPNSGNNYMSPPPIGNNEFNNNNQPQKSHNAAAIIWLILFFPIGLYIMWAKTNWNKIVKIVISVFFAFLMVLGIIGSFSDDDVPVSNSGIQSISIEEEKVRLDLSDYFSNQKTIFVSFSDNNSSELLESDFVFVFQDDNIASAKVVYVYDYSGQMNIEVTGLNAGTTKMHIESLDGTIKSNEIEIEVIGESPSALVNDEAYTETSSQDALTENEETTVKEEITTKEATTQKEEIEFIVNTETGKFHYPSCRHVKTMDEANKKTVKAESVEEMENKGYSPCGTCIN